MELKKKAQQTVVTFWQKIKFQFGSTSTVYPVKKSNAGKVGGVTKRGKVSLIFRQFRDPIPQPPPTLTSPKSNPKNRIWPNKRFGCLLSGAFFFEWGCASPWMYTTTQHTSWLQWACPSCRPLGRHCRCRTWHSVRNRQGRRTLREWSPPGVFIRRWARGEEVCILSGANFRKVSSFLEKFMKLKWNNLPS